MHVASHYIFTVILEYVSNNCDQLDVSVDYFALNCWELGNKLEIQCGNLNPYAIQFPICEDGSVLKKNVNKGLVGYDGNSAQGRLMKSRRFPQRRKTNEKSTQMHNEVEIAPLLGTKQKRSKSSAKSKMSRRRVLQGKTKKFLEYNDGYGGSYTFGER